VGRRNEYQPKGGDALRLWVVYRQGMVRVWDYVWAVPFLSCVTACCVLYLCNCSGVSAIVIKGGYFWDRWPYFAGKLSWDITTTQVNSALHPSGVAKSSTSFGWGKGGKVTSAGWQVTLCDLIWHVISCSGVVISITNCYIRFTLLYLLTQLVCNITCYKMLNTLLWMYLWNTQVQIWRQLRGWEASVWFQTSRSWRRWRSYKNKK